MTWSWLWLPFNWHTKALSSAYTTWFRNQLSQVEVLPAIDGRSVLFQTNHFYSILRMHFSLFSKIDITFLFSETMCQTSSMWEWTNFVLYWSNGGLDDLALSDIKLGNNFVTFKFSNLSLQKNLYENNNSIRKFPQNISYLLLSTLVHNFNVMIYWNLIPCQFTKDSKETQL